MHVVQKSKLENFILLDKYSWKKYYKVIIIYLYKYLHLKPIYISIRSSERNAYFIDQFH